MDFFSCQFQLKIILYHFYQVGLITYVLTILFLLRNVSCSDTGKMVLQCLSAVPGSLSTVSDWNLLPLDVRDCLGVYVKTLQRFKLACPWFQEDCFIHICFVSFPFCFPSLLLFTHKGIGFESAKQSQYIGYKTLPN